MSVSTEASEPSAGLLDAADDLPGKSSTSSCCRVDVSLLESAPSLARLEDRSGVRLEMCPSDTDSASQGRGDKMCRICHGDSPVEGLRSLCRCRGSVGLVHKECLEAWLSTSGSVSCELCGHDFQLRRVPRHRMYSAFWLWVTTQADRTQLLVDLMWFCLMTPFAALSGYLIYRSLNRYKEMMRLEVSSGEGGEEAPMVAAERNEPTMVNLVLLMSCLTLAVYYAWAVAIVQYHARWWYRWWLTTFVVTVLDPADRAAAVDTV